MKKIICILIVIFAIASCNKDDKVATIVLDVVSDATISMLSTVDSKVIKFTSIKSWSVSVTGTNTDWCSISGKSGENGGDSHFTINVTANTSCSDRSATIIIMSEGEMEELIITLTQSNPSIGTSISVPVKIKNGDKWFKVFDRNAGLDVPKGGVALNYTNDSGDDDHTNVLFKGAYYTWDEAMAGKNICPTGWRLPNKGELEVIKKLMQFSLGRAYLEDGDNKCYFPLSGNSLDPSVVNGRYWSSVTYDADGAYDLGVYTDYSHVNNTYRKKNSMSVRCVITVTE